MRLINNIYEQPIKTYLQSKLSPRQFKFKPKSDKQHSNLKDINNNKV